MLVEASSILPLPWGLSSECLGGDSEGVERVDRGEGRSIEGGVGEGSGAMVRSVAIGARPELLAYPPGPHQESATEPARTLGVLKALHCRHGLSRELLGLCHWLSEPFWDLPGPSRAVPGTSQGRSRDFLRPSWNLLGLSRVCY